MNRQNYEAIYKYDNPRDWLRSEFEKRQSKRNNYSMRLFAKTCGVSVGVLSLCLSGKRKLSFETGIKISQSLKLSIEVKNYLMALIEKDLYGEGLFCEKGLLNRLNSKKSAQLKKRIYSFIDEALPVDVYSYIGEDTASTRILTLFQRKEDNKIGFLDTFISTDLSFSGKTYFIPNVDNIISRYTAISCTFSDTLPAYFYISNPANHSVEVSFDQFNLPHIKDINIIKSDPNCFAKGDIIFSKKRVCIFESYYRKIDLKQIGTGERFFIRKD